MALKTINDLTADASPQSTDYVATWDGSASTSKKVTLANLVTGAANAAMLATVNTMTRKLTIAPSASENGLQVTPYAGASGIQAINIANVSFTGQPGPYLRVGYQNGASPAAGSVQLNTKSGTSKHVWSDDGGLLRISTASSPPTEATDTSAGTVVGAQTSHIDYKNVIGAPVDDDEALNFILAAAADVARFTYKNGSYNGDEFSGIVLDGDSMHRYGMDADEAHPAGRALNVINVIGDLLLTIRELERRLSALEA